MYKNGSDVQMCLDKEELILPEEPVHFENSTPHQKKMWDLRATMAINSEELLKQNLRLLCVIVMSLCDPIMEDKASCLENFDAIKHSRDTIKLLQVIKQLMYSNSSDNTIPLPGLHQYGKILADMENTVLIKKDRFPT